MTLTQNDMVISNEFDNDIVLRINQACVILKKTMMINDNDNFKNM